MESGEPNWAKPDLNLPMQTKNTDPQPALPMNTPTLGEPRFDSPIRRTVNDNLRVPEQIVCDPQAPPSNPLLFELAGARARLFFDPKQTRAGIVTCGGLCPGLNDVIRSLFLELLPP